jgi:regulator of RNase E activity RraA
LNSYQFVRSGDVIVVENRVADRAYFGCLNAQLAMRAGAVGSVVDGVTRDRRDVEKLNFPVFARGNYCVDIKSEGTVRSINMPIKIGGVRVENNDFVFADGDGVTIIPKKLWPIVRDQVLKGIEKEWQVGRAVALGVPPEKILSEIGEF